MKKLIYIIIFILTTLIVFAQNYPFNYERINIDFTGAVSNNICILAYGDGGITLRSSDGGENWEQFALLPDEYPINKIINDDGTFYGCADMNYGAQNSCYLFKSTDGKYWQKKNVTLVSKMKSITSWDDKLYILSTNSIMIYTKDLEYIYEIAFDPTNNPNEIFAFGAKLFMPLSIGKIITYEINNNNKENITDFHSMFFCKDSCSPVRMLSENTNLYVNVAGKVLKSLDTGNTWIQISDSLSSNYTIHNNNAYCVTTVTKNKFSLSLMKFYKQTGSDKNWSLIFSDPPERYVSEYKITDIQFISNDTIIVVGTDKLIFMSYNGGVSWVLKSNVTNGFLPIVFDKNTIFIASVEVIHIFKSTNGGITWLPQKYTSNLDEINDFLTPASIYFYMENKDNGFIIINDKVDNFDNFFYTLDGGQTIQNLNIIDFRASHLYGNPIVLKNDSNYNVYWPNMLMLPGHTIPNHETRIITLDKNFNFVKRTYLDSISFYQIQKIDDNGNLLAFGQETKYPDNKIHINYCLMKSTDSGNSWNIIFRYELPYNYQNYYFTNGYDSCFIYSWSVNPYHDIQDPDNPLIHYYYTDWQLHLLDIKNLKLYKNIFTDSLNKAISIFRLFDNNLYISAYGKLYYNSDFKQDPGNWKYIPSFFHSVSFVSDSLAYLYGTPKPPEAEFYRITPLAKTDVNDNLKYEIETQDYFFSYPPYPLPAKNELRSLIYWDLTLGIDNDEITVYDIYGAKICGKERISIDKLQPYSGYLVWDCSNVPTGVYLIVVKHGTITKTIKAIVNR